MSESEAKDITVLFQLGASHHPVFILYRLSHLDWNLLS